MPYTNTHDFRSSTAYQAGEDNELTTSPRIDLTRTRIRIILELPDESFASLGFQQNDSGERNESASNDDRELSIYPTDFSAPNSLFSNLLNDDDIHEPLHRQCLDVTVLTHQPATELICDLVDSLRERQVLDTTAPPTPWRLITSNGRAIQYDASLADYGVQPGDTLLLTTRPWSGHDIHITTAEALSQSGDNHFFGHIVNRGILPITIMILVALSLIPQLVNVISKNWGLWDEITSITRHNPPLASPDGHGYFLSLFAYSSLFPWWCLVAVALLSSSFCVFLAYIKTHHTIKPSGINGNGKKDTNYPSQPDGRYASLWARNSPPHSSYVLESTALWWAAAWALGSLSWSSPWMAVSLGCLCTALVCGAVTYFHLSVYKKNSAAVVGNSIGRIPGAINKSSDIISAIALLMFSGIMVLPLGLTFFSFVNPQVVFCVWLLLALFIHSWTGMLALRCAGVRPDPVPSTGSELDEADSPPLPDRPHRVHLAHAIHTGMSTGCAAVIVLSALCLAWSSPSAGTASLILVIAIAEGLRARLQARYSVQALARATSLACLAITSLTLFLADYPVGTMHTVALAAGTSVFALLLVIPVLPQWRVTDPTIQKAIEIMEAIMTAAAIPLALWVAGIFTVIRGLG
ncbi:EsaB/YukD family protein [Corynebacterium sp. c7Ub_26]